ncbi:MAG TPA: MFS transporter [Gaiellaceae bacterium]|nr:MFS transporter [Gaiellaceae bacterium]
MVRAATSSTGQRERVRVVFGALMLVLLLASLDQTIVSTALPTIVGELGGLEHLSWVVTAYLLASTVSGPVYGKLGDLYGRKIVLQSAIAIFLIGSMLCGIAQGMGALIAFRAVQGLGAGGLIVTTMAVVGDLVSPRERGRYQGLFGAVFGVSTVLGPLLGGFFVDHLSWRWIFYVNLPVGVAALAVIAVAFHPHAAQRRHVVDYAGAALLAGGLTGVVLYTSLGGTTYAWDSPQLVALLVAGVSLLVAFVLVERRAAEPLLPLGLFRNRTFTTASAIGFVVGLALFGSITFLPLYLQVVKGQSPVSSGLQLTPMMAGLLVTSIVSGQLISRFGRYRPFPIAGTALTTVALLLLATLDVDTPGWTISLYLVVLGLGLGMVMQVLVLAVQNAVAYDELGVATSGSTLFRQVGGSIGVALFGAIFANQLASELAARLPLGAAVPGELSPALVDRLPPAVREPYVDAFAAALTPVFAVAAAAAAVAFALTWLLREVPLRTTSRSDGLGESFASPRDDSSFRELERSLSVLARRDNRWRAYEDFAARAGLDLSPAELWLLGRIEERQPVGVDELRAEFPHGGTLIAASLADLDGRSLVHAEDGRLQLTVAGADVRARVHAVRCDELNGLLAGWEPERHAEIRQLVDELARSLASEVPQPAR